MKFYKKNRHFILGLFAIAIASLFFANQSSTLAAEIPREWEFAQKAGGTSNDYGYAMSVDADGNSYVAGYFQGTADFGDTTLVSSGSFDIFVAKLSSTGERLWAKKAGGISSDIGYAISVDADGNSYVAGYFGGTAGFGDDTLVSSGSADVFVAKLSSTGELLWAQKAGGTSNDYGYAMSVDADGNSYVAGYFGGTAGFGDDTLVSSGGYDVFVAKLSSTGEWLWAKKAGGTSYDIGNAISVDADGNLYVAGGFGGTADFGDNTLISSGDSDIFIAKLSSTGERLWAKRAGGTSSDIGYAISVDADGNSYVAGYFGGTAGFGDDTLVSSGSADVFVAKIGPPWVVLPNSTDNSEILEAFQKKSYEQSNGDFLGNKSVSLEKTNGLIPANLSLKNGSNKLSLPTNLQFKKSDTSDYNGIIYPPTTHSVATVDDKPVLSAISVGSNTESLSLTNGAATLGVPVDGANIGDPVSIYSSQDGSSWTYEKGGIVSDIDGQPYVSFTTDHFTYFAIAGSTGSFVINNDDYSTTSQTVTLTISAPSATGMRFSNDEITWSDREPISDTKSWELSSGYEEKTVYAQFIANGEIYSTSDSILYTDGASGNGTNGNLTLTITGGVTQCVYGTSLNLGSQDGNLGTEGYIFSGDFSPANRYCADYKGLSGWVFTIQTTDLTNENGGVISGSNVFISHDVPVVQGHDSCTGHNGAETQFYGSPLSLIEKAEVANNDKICKVDISNVKLKVDVPAYQAPGNYVGTLTITLPNGFDG